jgi:tetratricopeptide (TPR) repeat protein
MRKKRSPRKKTGTKKSKNIHSEPMPDRRAMDKMMADVTRLLQEQEFDSIDEINAYLQKMMNAGEPIPSSEPRTPLEKAQECMYEAWEAKGKRRIKLAKEALSISEDCADAYVLLAEESAKTLAEAATLYANGVAAGERALGEEMFAEAAGHFWGVLETRPYMRARAGLASCLWQLDQREEAIIHYQEMLKLNPGDNQGIRYVLLAYLLEENMDAQIEQLLSEYEEDAAAAWLYNWALFLFRQKKSGKKARTKLLEALKYNPHVPSFLLGRKRLPNQLPPYMGFGDESEAAYYVAEASHLWLQEEGALDWMRTISTEA